MQKTFLFSTTLLLAFVACSGSSEVILNEKRIISKEFNDYWNSNGAEISSYELTQARYGELRKGKAVTVFVTEPFSPSKYVKTDQHSSSDVQVLKCNFTKNFNTGIYPYSIMTSAFFPIQEGTHALKVSTSIQEWCGHVYMQLENKKKFEIKTFSYFESEGNQELSLEKQKLEDDVWSIIRIAPQDLPIGEHKMIPPLHLLRLIHVPLNAYSVTCTKKISENITTYQMMYPALKRTMKISYKSEFPHEIERWEETYLDGFENAKTLTTTGILIKRIRSKYWEQNKNSDSEKRTELGL